MICERDVAKARARGARMLADCEGVVKDTPCQDLLPRLETGLLSRHLGTARGTLFPQPRLALDLPLDGQGAEAPATLLMDPVHGHGWRLVHDGSLEVPAAGRGLEVIAVGMVVAAAHETERVLAACFRRHECHAWRPQPPPLLTTPVTRRPLQRPPTLRAKGFKVRWTAVVLKPCGGTLCGSGFVADV